MRNSEILSWRWAILGAVVVVLAGGIWVVRNGWPGAAMTGVAASEEAPVPMAQLMAPGALPDVWLGSKDAPVTVIEYASMTCTHCGRFHADVYPTLKSKYIDTGKVRFTLREFPLDPLATAAFMLARCTGNDEKRTAMVDFLFDHQQNWAFVDNPKDALLDLVRQAGFSKASFDACVDDKALQAKVEQIKAVAGETLHVDATPTFFINGKRIGGEMSVDELQKVLDPLLKS
jgi:protein-disulfide isomerase